jgi:general secretion pathway protein G
MVQGRNYQGSRHQGQTLIELVIVLTVLSTLSLAVIPIARNAVRRHREQQLRESLSEIREAIQNFKRDTVGMPCQGESGTFGWQPGDGGVLRIDPRSKVVISDCQLFTHDNPDRYPPSLEILVAGVFVIPRAAQLARLGGNSDSQPTLVLGSSITKKYLRAIPVDPMTGRADWRLRSNYDPPGASSWGGENVFTVSSRSNETSLSGDKYSDW